MYWFFIDRLLNADKGHYSAIQLNAFIQSWHVDLPAQGFLIEQSDQPIKINNAKKLNSVAFCEGRDGVDFVEVNGKRQPERTLAQEIVENLQNRHALALNPNPSEQPLPFFIAPTSGNYSRQVSCTVRLDTEDLIDFPQKHLRENLRQVREAAGRQLYAKWGLKGSFSISKFEVPPQPIPTGFIMPTCVRTNEQSLYAAIIFEHKLKTSLYRATLHLAGQNLDIDPCATLEIQITSVPTFARYGEIVEIDLGTSWNPVIRK